MSQDSPSSQGSTREVFTAFLKLGLTSFGGPIAHLGYFRTEFVARRQWLSDQSYSDLVALCQFLPGPTSSQVGMALGLGRAGWPGLVAAWLAFTLPSAIALILFGLGVMHHVHWAKSGWVHGFKVVAVAIVAQAVWGMFKSLCPDRPRSALAIVATLITLAVPSAAGQIAALAVTGAIGWRVLSVPAPPLVGELRYPVSRRLGLAALLLFVGLMLALPLIATTTSSTATTLLDGVYRSGALVFGGGHVVLPLLQATVVPSGAVGSAEFLAGYGAAQAIPGPLFTFAAYLGAVADSALTGWVGGLGLLGVIFLPGFLVLLAALPFWESLRHYPGIQSTMAGISAGVVGILLSALYDPLWVSAIQGKADFALALASFAMLTIARLPPALVVLLAGMGGWILML